MEIHQVKDDAEASANPIRLQITFFSPDFIELQEFVLLENPKRRRVTEWNMTFRRIE